VKFFRDKIEDSITLPAPPTDDIGEAEEVKVIVANRTAENVKSVMNHDRVPFYAIRVYCKENGLVFHENEFNDIIYQATPIINHFKNMFNRKRPIEIDKTINTLPSATNKTPSYPSGHATQSRLVARYVAGKFPIHEKELIKASNEGGLGRVQAGFHYPSDYTAGNLLAEKMYVLMNPIPYQEAKDPARGERISFKSLSETLKNLV